ncbi:hypothetical protein C0J52_09019 [Blattella germanica]|nr:hypothetical protein C0J52_09019 [Blattella germanica]
MQISSTPSPREGLSVAEKKPCRKLELCQNAGRITGKNTRREAKDEKELRDSFGGFWELLVSMETMRKRW